MIAADSIAPFIILLAIIYGIVNHLKEKAQPKPPIKTPTRTPAPRADEEERERRFLEALGVPPDRSALTRQSGGALRQPAPAPARPVPQPAPAAPRRAPRPAPPLPAGQEFPTLPILRTPEVSAWKGLETREVPLFQTVSSGISAAPLDLGAAVEARERPTAGDELRRLLRTPGAARSAILLREILGPPRGLPSGPAGPTVAST